jgi:hypothetical protein
LNNQSPSFPIIQPDESYFSPIASYSSIPKTPDFIKPLPQRIGLDEAQYLANKGALTIPTNELRNELIRAYIEFVHPFMPVLDIGEFVQIVESGTNQHGTLSLILYQAVMFSGAAFVDINHLYAAGYHSRKHARRDFFQKTRLLYDFDYESDRVSLVQALLLLTYYYETPDDQKDTWHWMGVATSVAHTIGLHRNPENSTMDAKRIKLWKRIWWSTYMRDRLIALGMRRPTRIKDEDYDVPMITLDDFEIEAIPDDVTCISHDCTIARDVTKQRELAILCIQKAKLCLCISHVLGKQYCVLNNNQGVANDRTTMMLLPKKLDPETSEVRVCHQMLQKWFDDLPPEARGEDALCGDASMDLNRSLLHMTYYSTVSALHRPQVFPATPFTAQSPGATNLLDMSRVKVREAAQKITSLAQALDSGNIVRYLPTTGVTVLLPAIIIHLLDIKDFDEEIRRKSLRGFCQCMNVLYKLRDMYAAADYSIAFLDAAVRKAGIQVSTLAPASSDVKMHSVMTVEDLLDAGRRLDVISMPPPASVHGTALTPPPDYSSMSSLNAPMLSGLAMHSLLFERRDQTNNGGDDEIFNKLENFLNSTPPSSEHGSSPSSRLPSLAHTGTTLLDIGSSSMPYPARNHDFVNLMKNSSLELGHDDFEALMHMENVVDKESWSFDDGGIHGFTHDMDWLGRTGTDLGNGVGSSIVL